MSTQKLIETFNDQGFVVLPSVISEEHLNVIFEDISSVFDRGLKSAGLCPSDYESCDSKMLALKAHNNKLKSHCYDVLGMLDSVQLVTSSVDITSFGRALTGTALCKQSVQIRMDSGDNSHLLPMHQELELMSLMGIAVWIPLIDILDDTVGGLRVVPGSHKRGLMKHVTKEESVSGYSEVIWEGTPPQIEHIRMKKGDALLFHPFLVMVQRQTKPTR